LKIWNEEQISAQWNEGLICPVLKKGDRLNCNKCRSITLLNIANKIYALLLNKRLTEIAERKMGEQQSGFRPNRSTIDNIFVVR
jgi:hypothetical protein